LRCASISHTLLYAYALPEDSYKTEEQERIRSSLLAEKSGEKEMSNARPVSKSLKTETVVFLALTLGLTFLLNLIMWINYTSIVLSIELLSLATRVQMIIPTFSAIILNLFVLILLYYFSCFGSSFYFGICGMVS